MTDTYISPEAVEQLAHHDDIGGDALRFAPTMRAISAALTQSRAETAAAYERAAMIAEGFMSVCLDQETDPEVLTGYGRGMYFCARQYQTEIRALATPDQSSALAAIEAAAEARGMRMAAAIAYQFEGNDKLRCAILTAIPQGEK